MSIDEVRARVSNAAGWAEGGIHHMDQASENHVTIGQTIGSLLQALAEISPAALLRESDTMAGHFQRCGEVVGTARKELIEATESTQSSKIEQAIGYFAEADGQNDTAPIGRLNRKIRTALAPQLQQLVTTTQEVQALLEACREAEAGVRVPLMLGVQEARDYANGL